MGIPRQGKHVQPPLWISVKFLAAMDALFPAGQAAVITVSELLRGARIVLENRLPLAWVSGEISNLSRAPSGHCYFTLKDEKAQAECILYRSRAGALDWELKNGTRVEVRALATLYEPRGRFQLQVEAVRRSGPGPLYERFLRLKEKLEREGLFDPAGKRALPPHPGAIGVITSLAGAALHDVLTALARRNASLPVIVYPAPVQGEGAARRLAATLALANRRAECDVLLLVRGGGSLEDLWQFNEEALARAIRASAIPVVVGVGHETDFTIADFAADLRAPTPTAAAELCSPARAALLARILDLARCLAREMRRQLGYSSQAADHLAKRLVHPAERLRHAARVLAQLEARLAAASGRPLEALRYRLGAASMRLSAALARRLSSVQARLDRARAALHGLDPAAVLARGYSITRNAQGQVILDAGDVSEGERLHTFLARGAIESEVKRRA